MFMIKAPNEYTGKMWGLLFANGEAQTDDAYLANKLQGKGYTVLPNIAEKSIYDGLSRAELDAIALERGLDIKGCSNKAMVITLLEADDEAQGKEIQE